jgi:hypothetical protein
MAGSSDPARRTDLEKAWQERLEDSKILHEAARYSSSIVHGFYALEILLKAHVCRRLDLEELHVKFQVHDLNFLLILTGLKKRLYDDSRTLERWMKIYRYQDRINRLRYGQESARKKDCEAFHRSLHAMANDSWNSSTYGVIPWITRQD